jgi:hypothetical protein
MAKKKYRGRAMNGARKGIRKYGSLLGSGVMMAPVAYAAIDGIQYGMTTGSATRGLARGVSDVSGYDMTDGSFSSANLGRAAVGVGVCFVAGKAIKYLAKRV